MKKVAFILIVVMLFLNLVSCSLVGGNKEDENGLKIPPEGEIPDSDASNDGQEDNTNNGEKSEENLNPHLITVNALKGLNEQIYLSLTASDGFRYKVFYKNDSDKEYTELDNNLMIDENGKLGCYILGIKKGNYKIKIEAESKNENARKIYSDIAVEEQDRSGYAHFGYSGGIGAYNDDGTVKENAEIIYVTNENKNTVRMTIDGTECVGLVNILQAQYKSDIPLLVRVIGKISTNQWNYKNVEPRLTDGSNLTDDFFDNTFSTEYGENLANLKVQYSDKKDGQTYIYTTTPEGLSEPRVKGGSKSTTTYKGSDFPSLVGRSVYDDDSSINMISVQAASNITIEGVGTEAEFFQFGIGFEECNSIEIKNLTFTNYPEDALNFIGKDDVTASGNYWVHNNTFNNGYNAWDITGERDKYAGDGSVDMAIIHSMTLAYNKFDSCKKTMLVGNADSSRCINISIHHNHFYKVGSRLPLCRNSNVHSYNNYFDDCSTCASVRVNSYLFSEANYYYSCSKPFDISSSAVKSYADIFNSSSGNAATIVTSRDQIVSNNCKPDKTTDYSKFDTNPELFYYDAELGISDVSVMLNADDVPDFVSKYAGAGCRNQLDVAD